METPEDILRSLRKWLGVVLPAPWDVQYQRDENMERPAVVVQTAIPRQNTGSAYKRKLAQDFDVFVYPVGVEGEPTQSKLQAEALAHSLDIAMTRGVRVGDADYSYTMRLPTFNYAGIAWNAAQLLNAVPYVHLPVDQWSVEVRPDPEDDTLFTVVAGLRISWMILGDGRRFRGLLLTDTRAKSRTS